MEEVMMPYEDAYGAVPPRLHHQQRQLPREAELIVSVAAPYRIQRVSEGVLDLLGFSSMEVVGRSLGVVQGPSTDVMKLNSLIKCAALGMTNHTVIAIYARSGSSMLMRVDCTPVGPNEAKISLIPSDAGPVKLLAQDDDCVPKVILSATAPHIVQSVSSSFTELYGIYGPQIVGRSLHLIFGPRTDMRVWNSMLKGAIEGLTQCDSLYTCASDCTEFVVDATITPAHSQDDRITHLVCHFSVPPAIALNNLVFADANHHRMHHHHHQQQRRQQQQQQHRPLGFPPRDTGYSIVTSPETYPSNNSNFHVSDVGMGYHQDVVDMHTRASPSIIAHHDEAKLYQHRQRHLEQQQHAVHASEDLRHTAPARPGALMQPPEHHRMGQQYPMMMPVPEHRQMPVTPGPAPTWGREAELAVTRFGAGMHVGGMESVPAMTDLRALGDGMWAHRQQAGVALMPEAGVALMPDGSMHMGDAEQGSDEQFTAIFPRCKAGQGRKNWQGPVLITLEVLESMADVSLSEAAKKLGVSSTAIKKACRKLGVQRWPYRKQAEGAQQGDMLSHYNEAYVRKLFRKYSPKVPKDKTKGSPCASSPSDSIATTPDSSSSKPATPALALPAAEEDAPAARQGEYGGGGDAWAARQVEYGGGGDAWPQEAMGRGAPGAMDGEVVDPTHHSSWLPPGSAGFGSDFVSGDGSWASSLPL